MLTANVLFLIFDKLVAIVIIFVDIPYDKIAVIPVLSKLIIL